MVAIPENYAVAWTKFYSRLKSEGTRKVDTGRAYKYGQLCVTNTYGERFPYTVFTDYTELTNRFFSFLAVKDESGSEWAREAGVSYEGTRFQNNSPFIALYTFSTHFMAEDNWWRWYNGHI